MSFDGYRQTAGPQKEAVIIHGTDREVCNRKELNYCGVFTIQEVVTVSWFRSVMYLKPVMSFVPSCGHLPNIPG